MIHLESLLFVRSVPGAIFTEPCGSEFEVGGATSEDEVRKRASRKGGLMDILES